MISKDAERLLREYIRKKYFTLSEEFEEAKIKYKGE